MLMETHKLNERNYVIWKPKMKSLLKFKDSWEIVTGEGMRLAD